MNPEDRRLLLAIAREAVVERVTRTPSLTAPVPAGALATPRAVFVTLRVRGSLRGCTGLVEGPLPLHEAVRCCAVSAATEDTRFDPIETADLPHLQIEVSLLSPPVRTADPASLEIGTHGVIITRGARRGLLLPKVAVEHGFGVEAFLDAGCEKAGLMPGAWHAPDVSVDLFTAEVFGDPGVPTPSRSGPRD